MKKLLLFLPIIALPCVAQTITVSAPLSNDQKAAFKTLLAQSVADTNSPYFGQTNLTVAQFATNYVTLGISDVVTEASRNRRNAIAGRLASAPEDALTAIESVLKWSSATDLTKAQVIGMTNVLAKLPLATAAKMNAAATDLQ